MASAPSILYPSRPSRTAATFDETRLSKSVLYLAYFFPPRGGAGVQRSLKFAKYLPEFGWRPLIVANGALAADGVTRMQDSSLLRDLPPDTVIRYTTDETKIENNFRR